MCAGLVNVSCPSSYGTGSYPPLQKGLHLKIRHAAKSPPLSAPYFLIASAAYSEHVGVNLQAAGSHGDIAFL